MRGLTIGTTASISRSVEGPNQERRWRERIHPEDTDRYVRAGDAAASGLTDHYVAEYRILTRSGAWRWIHERGRVSMRDATGKAQHFIAAPDIPDGTIIRPSCHPSMGRRGIATE